MPGSPSDTIKYYAEFFGVEVLSNDTDADIVLKIYDRVQNPPAGGNEHDWKVWASSISVSHRNSDGTVFIEKSIDSNPVEHYRWGGSIDLFLLSDWSLFPAWKASTRYDIGDYVLFEDLVDRGQIRIYRCIVQNTNNLPSTSWFAWTAMPGATAEFCQQAKLQIEDLRVLGLWDNAYSAAVITPIDVSAIVTGDIDIENANLAVRSFIDGSKIKAVNSRAKITSLLVDLGAETVDLISPATDLIAGVNVKFITNKTSLILR